MTPLPISPDLLHVARRVVWFKPPEQTLAEPIHFLAHVMTYGTPEDLAVVTKFVGRDEFRDVLDHAPPGVFDPRSWAYWNLMCGRPSAPPMPTRDFG